MAVTLREIHDYCRPILERRNFRFRHLHGQLSFSRIKEMRLAKAFAHPGPNAVNFMMALQGAKPAIREPVLEEIQSLDGRADASHEDRMLMVRRVQEHFLKIGIHTDINRPSAVGMVIKSGSVAGVPVYFLLGESEGISTFCGRYYEPIDGIGSRLTINVTSAATRLVEVLDIMFGEARDKNDRLERALMLRDPEALRAWISKVDFAPDEVPVSMFLHVMSVRESIRALKEAAKACDSPSEFIRLALNAQLDSVLAHETAHLLERKANGQIPLTKHAKELIAYLIEAVYSRPDISFRSMLDRRIEIERVMPPLYSDIRAKGGLALLEDSSFLRAHALMRLDALFLAISGKPHSATMDTGLLTSVQGEFHIDAATMPLIERAMCNTSLR